ncbi:EAL domain-containing protein [Aquabacterium sp.]|uniref:EAL domain-containing protein n=1 Tax=Aquabacterium sp. TaxID=1872578 RepID=UPI003B70F579
MKREHVLPVLYDLTLTIGSEVHVQPLLGRVLQRLLFHTSFPVGVALLSEPGHMALRCEVALGDQLLSARQGQALSLPSAYKEAESGWLGESDVRALGGADRLVCGLRLPIPGCGVIVLLAPEMPRTELPLVQVFSPVLRNLARTVELCRGNDQLTQRLQDDRDKARHDLFVALRHSEEQRRLLRLLTDTLPDLFWMKSSEGRYLFCNKGFEGMYGVPEAQLLGHFDRDFVGEAQAAAFRSDDLIAAESNKPYVFEEWLDFVDGRPSGLYETTKVPVRTEDGSLLGIMGIARDITERRKTEQQLLLAASVFTHAREGIMITQADGTIVDVNETFTDITGYPREEAIGKTPRILQSGRQTREFYQTMWHDLAAHGHWSGEVWNRRRSGEIYAEQITISSVTDAKDQVTHYVALFSDVSKQKEHEQQLERIAHYDALTLLPNRVLLADRLQQAMFQAKRRGLQVAVAYLDLDGFKAINDEHGHSVGDSFLSAIADRMKRELRESDTLARLGGDEFVAVLIDLRNTADAEPLLQRLQQAAFERCDVEGLSLQASASIGVTFYRGHDDIDADQLLRQADQAMYQAKVAGKNRCYIFDPDKDRDARGLHEHLQDIARALKDGEFVLHYQPKVHLRSGHLMGAEALIRWRHPMRGILSPAVFLPVTENHPLAVDIGERVIETALVQIGAWRQAGHDIPVSVNIGARHLQQDNFIERLDMILARHPDVPPSFLQIEIVETSALQDISQISHLLAACASRGVRSAIDDFGTGYSSLSYLKRLPAHQLKIDQSFVRDMLEDPDDLAILEGVMGLAKAFDREVIAEGIETIDHGVMLLQLGCELGQGFGISRPLPAAELLPWLSHWQPHPRWVATQTLGPTAVSVLRASIDVRAWINALDAFLDGRREQPPELDPGRCHFGRWLQKAAQQAGLSEQDLHEADLDHLRLHDQATALMSLKREGRLAELREHIVLLRQEGESLIGRITDWAERGLNKPA